jgi:hypothetical protein
MQNKVIELALNDFRELLFEEIGDELEERKSVDLDGLTLRKSIDGDGYNICKRIYLDEKGWIKVDYTDHETGHDHSDLIELFSVDEILEIINAL